MESSYESGMFQCAIKPDLETYNYCSFSDCCSRSDKAIGISLISLKIVINYYFEKAW